MNEILAIHDQAAKISLVFQTSGYYAHCLEAIYKEASRYEDEGSLDARLLDLAMKACHHIGRESIYRVDALRIAIKPLRKEARRRALSTMEKEG